MGTPVQVPGHGVVQFPDGMNDDQIADAIRQLTAPPAPSIDKEIADWRKYAPPRSVMGTAEDILTRGVSSATFGLAEKAKAKLWEALGKGTYDENLAENRRQVEEAGENLGAAGTIASDITGGLLTGSALQHAGVTLAGRLPATAPLLTKLGIGGAEGAGYAAAHGAGHTDTGDWRDYVSNAMKAAPTGFAIGAAAPAIAQGVQRVITPFAAASPQRADLVKTLRNAGVDVTAGQATGNSTLRMMEDTMAKLPLGRMFGGRPGERQMEQLTEEAMKRAGIPVQPGMQATPDVLRAGRQQTGSAIGAIQNSYPVTVDPPMAQAALQVVQALPTLQPGQRGVIQHYLGRMVNSPTLAPEEAQTLRSQIGRAIRAQNGQSGDKVYQQVLIDLKNTLDDGLARTIQAAGNPGDVAALQQLRQQYANNMTLSDAIGSSGASGAQGTLTPTALASATARGVGKDSYVQGTGGMADIARASSGVLRSPPDSGTATREGMLDILKLAVSPLAAAVNRPWMQAYWGNQKLPPGPSPPGVYPSIVGAGTAGDADTSPFGRARRSLLDP